MPCFLPSDKDIGGRFAVGGLILDPRLKVID